MDDPRLDAYISTIGGRLKRLSSAQREEELREIRQHLETLVAGHLAAGISQDEAVDAALRQFGHAEEMGRELAGAWQQRLPRLWPALLVYLCQVLAIFVLIALANDKPTDIPYGWPNQLLLAVMLPIGFLVLNISAYVRARRAS